MQILKSGSLTSKNGGIISLTPEDLRNHSFAVFSINCKCAVDFLGLKDCHHISLTPDKTGEREGSCKSTDSTALLLALDLDCSRMKHN